MSFKISQTQLSLPRYTPSMFSNNGQPYRTVPASAPECAAHHVSYVSESGPVTGRVVVCSNAAAPLELALDDRDDGADTLIMLGQPGGLSVHVHLSRGSFVLQYPDTGRHLVHHSGRWHVFGNHIHTYCLFPSRIRPMAEQPSADISAFGCCVARSSDGQTTAVSAPDRAGGSGGVYIYTHTAPDTPVLLSTCKSEMRNEGQALVMDASGTIVGWSVRQNEAQRFVLYALKNTQWKRVYSIGGPVTAAGLSADGNTLVLGAPGMLRVFVRKFDTWELVSTFEEADDPLFGTQVCISGSGSIVCSVSAKHTGVVYDVKFAEGRRTVLSDGGATHGSSVAADFLGRTVAVGSATQSRISVFTSSDTGRYTVRPEYHFDRDNIASNMCGAGHVVALAADGNTLVVGAPKHASDAGAVFVFTRTAAVWTLRARADGEPGAMLGYAAAVAHDGATAAVAAFGAGKIFTMY